MRNVYVARQPIVDAQQDLYAYELLYRSGQEDHYTAKDGDTASLDVISHSFQLIGLETLTGGKKAFVNFTQGLLENDVATLLPNNRIVVEILETVEPSKRILKLCRRLKDLGYLLALDDFLYRPRFAPLLDLADIVKVDFLTTSASQRQSIMDAMLNRPVQLLAERVETQQDFEEALALGYSLFQGYFFSKPSIVQGHDVSGLKHVFAALIAEVTRPELDWDRTEELIMSDPAISFKLLRFINSAALGVRRSMYSIRDAMVFLGEQGIRRWVTLLAMRRMAADRPNTLLVTAILRARFCQLVAHEQGVPEEDEMFLVGLFSLLDAILQTPLPEILAELPVSPLIRRTLLGEQSALLDVLNLCRHYEKGNWGQLDRHLERLNLSPQAAGRIYLEAVELANQFVD